MYCNTGWSGENTVLRNRVGDAGGDGVPKQEGCLRIMVLILGQSPRTKRISCKGQFVGYTYHHLVKLVWLAHLVADGKDRHHVPRLLCV